MSGHSPNNGSRPRARATAIILGVILASTPLLVPSSPCAASDEDLLASVDPTRMAETILTLQEFGSREFHLESSRQAAAYILDVLQGYGVSAEMQHFTVGNANVSNVVGTIQGDDDNARVYLFGAHYDSENRAVIDISTAENITAPGADDDASGVAAVIEIARILAEDDDFPVTVKFVLFGAEEMGYDDSGGTKGSQFFVTEEVARGQAYAGTAILDMVGYRAGVENKATLIVNSDDLLADSTVDSVEAFDIDLSLDVRVAPFLTYSDHASFWQAGLPSMLVIEELNDGFFPVNPYYHTSSDMLDTISLEQVVAVTQALLGGLLLLEGDGGGDGRLLLFGVALMSAAILTVSVYVYVRRRRGRTGNGGLRDDGT